MNDTPDAPQSADSTAKTPHGGDPPPSCSKHAGRPAKKPRSKTERNIVWGLIGVMLVVLAFELRAHIGFKLAYDRLSAAMEADEDGESVENILTESKVKSLLNGVTPAHSESLNYLEALASRVDTYEWSGPLRTRSLYVYYGVGDNPDVVSVSLEKGRSVDSYMESLGDDHATNPAAEQESGENTDSPAGEGTE